MAKEEVKVLRTKKERLAYIEKCVKRGLAKKAKMKKQEQDVMNYTETDENGY